VNASHTALFPALGGNKDKCHFGPAFNARRNRRRMMNTWVDKVC